MKSHKASVKYQAVSLAVPFLKEITKHIEKDEKYRSVADYVRSSVREKMARDNLENDELWQKAQESERLRKISMEAKVQNLQQQIIDLQKELLDFHKNKKE